VQKVGSPRTDPAKSRGAKIEDVARDAGVSTATVSRVLSRPHLVKPSTRANVLRSVQSLSYLPSASAQALASGKTHTVGCVVPSLDHAIFSKSTHAMQQYLAQHGIQLLIASHEYDLQAEFEIVRRLQQRRVDALVLVGTDHTAKLWRLLKEWQNPILLSWACDKRLPSIGFDNFEVGRAAADYLVGLGHKKIGIVSGFTANNDRARARVAGALSALQGHGIAVPDRWQTEHAFNLAGGAEAFKKLMSQRNKPTAIFCGNDLLACGVLLEAQRQGLKVPDQLSVIGVDNNELSQSLVPALTTIGLAADLLGKLVAQYILRAIAQANIPRQTVLPFELMVRASTAARLG
jgi:LacI family transcriptional regulator